MAAMWLGMTFSHNRKPPMRKMDRTRGRRTLTVAHAPEEPSVRPKMNRITETEGN